MMTIHELIHKPWFFVVSVIGVLLLSLGTWSLLHGGQPFVAQDMPGSRGNMRSTRGMRNFGSGGMQRNMSGYNRMWSGARRTME